MRHLTVVITIVAGLVLAVALALGLYRAMNGAPLHYAQKPTHELCNRLFNDKNPRHLQAARRVGVPPPANRAEAKALEGQLVMLADNKYYKVDRLTHSVPYLTRGGSALLDMIAEGFADSLQAAGIAPYRLIVTSVLRTAKDVERLRKVNENASANSAHCYATTFDITYARFDRVGGSSAEGRRASEMELKGVLMVVLRRLQIQHKCYVKYEQRQKCFHITTRMR